VSLRELVQRTRQIGNDYTYLIGKFERDGHMDQIQMSYKRPAGRRGARPTNIVFTMKGFLLALQYWNGPRASRFRLMQAHLTAQVTTEIADQRHREDQARIAELVRETASQDDQITTLECGVWNYIRDELGLKPLYEPWNADANRITVILRELRSLGLIKKCGPKQVNYFKDVPSMERGKAIIERHRIRMKTVPNQKSKFAKFFKR
jgi:hypothetical protein